MTRPLFIVGSGRSGTLSFGRLLNSVDGIEAHHEFCNLYVQEAAMLYTMGLTSKTQTRATLSKIYESALRYSDAQIWVDSSHKLAWLVDLLADMFSDAKFLYITRHGGMVASEFFYKFLDGEHTCYEDRAMALWSEWLKTRREFPPPPDKRFLWKIPQYGQPFYEEFKTWNRFQRICYHWWETNTQILDSITKLPKDRFCMMQLEEIVKDEYLLQATIRWAGIPYAHSMFDFLQTPQNVVQPIDYGLTDEQNEQFKEICGLLMHRLGYGDQPTYEVSYLANRR